MRYLFPYFANMLMPCIFKSFILLPMSSEVLCFFYSVLFFHLEGFLQLTSEFRLLAHILYLRVRQQKAGNWDEWNWLTGGLVNWRWHGCTLLLDSQSGKMKQNRTYDTSFMSSACPLSMENFSQRISIIRKWENAETKENSQRRPNNNNVVIKQSQGPLVPSQGL